MDCVQCEICLKWQHASCADLEFPFINYVCGHIDFICSKKCEMSVLPFNKVVSNDRIDEFYPDRDSYPCKICRNECLGDGLMDCIQCDVCEKWLHFECSSLTPQEFKDLCDSTHDYICSKRCFISVLPFNAPDSNSSTCLDVNDLLIEYPKT